MPRSPFHDLDLAQNDLCLGLSLSFVGAFRSEPVARLYRARPFAVSPAPFDTGNFSPRPTARLGPRFLAIEHLLVLQDVPQRVARILARLLVWCTSLVAQHQRTRQRDHPVTVRLTRTARLVAP